jgi:hypothetical protein
VAAPWTAQILSVTPSDTTPGQAQVAVVLSNGTEKHVVQLIASDATTLKARCLARTAQFDAVDATIGTLAPGPFDLTPDPAPKDPNPALTAFIAAKVAYEQWLTAVKLTLVAANDPAVANAKAAMVAAWAPALVTSLELSIS